MSLFDTDDDEPMQTQTYRLPVTIIKQIDELARQYGKNKSKVARALLATGLAIESQTVKIKKTK